MRLPDVLHLALEEILSSVSPKDLKGARELLSHEYRMGKSSSQSFRDSERMLAYLATRLPATFGACASVFAAIRQRAPLFSCRSLLDLGAGPGTASWAALEVFPELSMLHLVERESMAIEQGQLLSRKSGVAAWEKAKWHQASFESLPETPAVDMAVLSYAYGELPEPLQQRLIDQLWERKIPIVAVIEPGTPKGFERIRALRASVIDRGAAIVAPCPHKAACPMPANDWCHFSARIERTKLHRQLKEGTLGYEDEKFSYVVYAHPSIDVACIPIEGRVVRHPHKGSGHVRFSLCTKDGTLRDEVVTRSNKSQYRQARDLEWGDVWE